MGKIWSFATFLLFLYANAEKVIVVTMIADVIKAMEKPSSIIATLCWSDHEKILLHSALMNEKTGKATMLQFTKTDVIPERHAQDQHIVFLADLDCSNISYYLERSSSRQHFRSPFRWILISDMDENKTQSLPPEIIEDIDVLPDAEVIVARQLTQDSFDLSYIYKTSSNQPWQIEPYGYWNAQSGFQKNAALRECTASRRMNLNRFKIPMGYVLTDPDSINHLEDGVNDYIDTITKVNFPTNNHLLDFLNASRRYIFANTWGYKVNGTWNGLTGLLIANEIEIGGSPMFFTSERISVVDYITSPTPTRSKFVFQQPKLSYTNNLFLLSFRASVWYSLLGLLFLMFLALLIVANWEWMKHKQDEDKKKDSGILRGNPYDVGLIIFGAACQQGSPVELKGSLGRVVMLIIYLSVIFLYTSYSANIVALLQSSSTQIKTLEDLLHSRLKFGVHDNVFNRYYFSTATEPTRKAIYQTKVAPPGVKPRFISMEEGVKNMQKGLYAFHMEIGVGYKFVGKYFREGEKCGLMELQYLQVIDPWLAVRKNTPYKEMFKIGYKRIQEHGLQIRENHLLYEKRPKCSGRESNFISVSMVDCYPALLLMTYGIILSVFLLVIEILLKKKHDLKNRLCCNSHESINKDDDTCTQGTFDFVH